MTVRELIEKLQAFDGYLPVVIGEEQDDVRRVDLGMGSLPPDPPTRRVYQSPAVVVIS